MDPQELDRRRVLLSWRGFESDVPRSNDPAERLRTSYAPHRLAFTQPWTFDRDSALQCH